MKKRALLIAIHYYGTEHELIGCGRDIEIAAKYLDGYDLTILKDKPTGAAKKKNPTRKNILRKMRRLAAATKPGDVLYVHFSGRGDSNSLGENFIRPVDYKTRGVIHNADLFDALIMPLAPGAKLRIVFDCWRSGVNLLLPITWTPGKPGGVIRRSVELDVIFITCYSENISYWCEDRPNGILTWALIKSLYDIRDSGVMSTKYTWKDLGEMIRFRLMRLECEQVPQIYMASRSQLSKIVDL